jgi:hypothetical protein
LDLGPYAIWEKVLAALGNVPGVLPDSLREAGEHLIYGMVQPFMPGPPDIMKFEASPDGFHRGPLWRGRTISAGPGTVFLPMPWPEYAWSLSRFEDRLEVDQGGRWEVRPISKKAATRDHNAWIERRPERFPRAFEVAERILAPLGRLLARELVGRPARDGAVRITECSSGIDCLGLRDEHPRRPIEVASPFGDRGAPRKRCPACLADPSVVRERHQRRMGFRDPKMPEKRIPYRQQSLYRLRLEDSKRSRQQESNEEVNALFLRPGNP